jgi:hypothetical protein
VICSSEMLLTAYKPEDNSCLSTGHISKFSFYQPDFIKYKKKIQESPYEICTIMSICHFVINCGQL